MKIRNLIYLITFTSVVFSSCSNGDDRPLLPDTGRTVSFSTTIASNAQGSRAIDNTWIAGNKVGVFMIPQGGTLKTALASNKKYSASATGELTYASEDQAIYFPSDGTKVDFVAYYPYTTVTDNNQIAVDVTDQSSPEAIDLLYAPTNKGFSRTSGKVNLNFKHQLTRMVLDITKAPNVTLDKFGVKLLGTRANATFDLATGTLNPTAGSNSVIAYKVTDKGNNKIQAEVIVLPTDNLGDDAAIEFTIGSQKMKQRLSGISLKSSTNYTNEVNISNNNGEPVVLIGQATITDWITVTGDNINLDADHGSTDPDPNPTDPSTGTEKTIFAETFGTVEKKGNGYWPSINEFTSWDNSTLTFKDNYLAGDYSNASIRSTSSMDSHVWFAANKNSSLEISGFSTSGYKSMKLSYTIAANLAGNQNVIQVKCSNTTITVPSLAFSAINTYQIVELSNLPENFTSIEFISSTDTNVAGYRLDNVKLVGTK